MSNPIEFQQLNLHLLDLSTIAESITNTKIIKVVNATMLKTTNSRSTLTYFFSEIG